MKVLELFLPDILNESTFLTVYNELSGMLKQKKAKSGESGKIKRKHNIRKNSVKRRCESRKTADK